MKIAVTGANGYIGKHVIEALKKQTIQLFLLT